MSTRAAMGGDGMRPLRVWQEGYVSGYSQCRATSGSIAAATEGGGGGSGGG